MDSMKLLVGVFGTLVLKMVTDVTLVGSHADVRNCKFPAMYNFGDSNSDTGGISAALGEIPPPNGETFFGHPSGRSCDGRLIIDFIAERLKLPYLSAYLDSVGTDFRHGANFATGGSSIRPGGYSPFHLGVQISQFKQFKARTNRLRNQRNLPRAMEFSKALYTFDIGQNDLAYGFQHSSEEDVWKSIPDILSQFAEAVKWKGVLVLRQSSYSQLAGCCCCRFAYVESTPSSSCTQSNQHIHALRTHAPGRLYRKICSGHFFPFLPFAMPLPDTPLYHSTTHQPTLILLNTPPPIHCNSFPCSL
ncbi:unnamed protein product [Linum tenue]|uniref:GDSL esterase/lipase n=2 Tax=Linum TaxID=4005 RepID=A0AAV0N9G9_9ROSI|nr:unnamed protein product [Linum tenue]